MDDYEKNIQAYKDKINKLDNEIHKIQKPQELHFVRTFFKSFAILFVGWPIIIFLIESTITIIYLITGLISYLFLKIDITSEGTPVSNFIGSILYPNGDIFFYMLLTWRHFWIVFLALVIVLIITKFTNNYQIKEFKEKTSSLNEEKNRIKIKLDEEIRKYKKEQEAKRIKFEKEQKAKRIKFEKEQKAKGLIKYEDKWDTPEQVKKWKEVKYGINKNFMNTSHFEFEEFVAKLFRKMGYDATVTRKTGDFGIDIIAKDQKDTIAIQVKQNKIGNNVGNVTVQQILGAMWRVKANKAIVVTTSDFTVQAKEQAREAPVELWDLRTLKQIVKKYFIDMDEMKK